MPNFHTISFVFRGIGIGFAGLLALLSAYVSADTVVSADISSDITWSAAQSPYVVPASLAVRNGAKLFIEAGVVVYMGNGASLDVQSGGVHAMGSAANPVRVTSFRLKDGQPAAPGDWGQWIFGSGTVDTRIEHAIFEYGKGIVVNAAAPVFNGVEIRNNQGAAMSIDLLASPVGRSNRAHGNTIDAILVPGGDIAGQVVWGIKGIPYLLESGEVSVGVSPLIATVSPSSMQQGGTQTFTLTGFRLGGLSKVSFARGDLSAQLLAGDSDSEAKMVVSAAPEASLGAVDLTALVDAGVVRKLGAFSIQRAEPALLAVTPTVVYYGAGSSTLEVAGKNLLPTTEVVLDGDVLPSTYLSTTRLTMVFSGQMGIGEHELRLRTPDPLNAGEFLWSEALSIKVSPPQVSVLPSVVSLLKGETRLLTVQLPFAASEEVSFALSSSAPLLVSVPGSVTVPSGAVGATFAVQGVAPGAAVISINHPSWPAAEVQVSILSAQPSLLSEYRLDEAAWSSLSKEVKDSSSNANHGVAVNGAKTGAAKLCNGGLFDGVANRHVSLPATIQDLAVNTFTMMLWVKPGRAHELDAESSWSTAGVSGQNYALYPTLNTSKWNWDYSGYAGVGISVGTNGISVYEHAGSYMPPVLVWPGAVAGDDWTHITLVYNNGVPALYVNGIFRKTGIKGSHSNVVPTYVIGSPNYGNYSLGVDEYKIFAGSLTATDIAALYANESAGMNWDGSPRLCGGE